MKKDVKRCDSLNEVHSSYHWVISCRSGLKFGCGLGEYIRELDLASHQDPEIETFFDHTESWPGRRRHELQYGAFVELGVDECGFPHVDCEA